MTTDNALSSSCQSIATITLGPACSTTNIISIGANINDDNDNDDDVIDDHVSNINYGHYVPGTGSLGRLKYKSIDASDEELDYTQLSQSTHLLGRVKSERFLAAITKTNEDRRRRTIIVEKKNGSYGFTLQSYGIHYKKDQEVEMITYVDYVEYDGPAYKAGMREGDVILAINGKDMEKADHKTIVDYIKSCDTRMRLVVLFENCVRKVDLHMRYIQLQNILQKKMNELEQVCLRERELLEGKWKTHSLPARKKAAASPILGGNGTGNGNETGCAKEIDSATMGSINEQSLSIHRSTYSTEDMANFVRLSQQIIIPPPAQFMFSYHYLDPTYRYVLKPSVSTNSAGTVTATDDCFITLTESVPHVVATAISETVAATPQQKLNRRGSLTQGASTRQKLCEKHKASIKQQQQQQQQEQHMKKVTDATQKSKHCHGHSCNPCIDLKWKKAATTSGINADNISLDAYDLASPCCDAHCVPIRRRPRHHHSKEHHHNHHKHKHRERDRDCDREREGDEIKERLHRSKSQYHATSKVIESNNNNNSTRSQYHHHHHQHRPAHNEPQHQRHCHASSQQQQPQQQYQHQQLQQQYQQQQEQVQRHRHKSTGECGDSQSGSIRSRYFDLTSTLPSHCSLHSCSSSQDFKPADSSSYTTSFSSDTLFWDPKSENAVLSRQSSIKSKQTSQQQQRQQEQQQQQQQQYYHVHHHHNQQAPQQHQHQHQQQKQQHEEQQDHPLPYGQNVYQHRYHVTATHVNPSQIYPNTASVHKPKSWDNLTTATITAHGYGYLDTLAAIKPFGNIEVVHQRHSIPRKNGPYGRYSTYVDTIENYAPPPTEFVEQVTTTATTITAKSSSDDLLLASSTLKATQSACDYMITTQQQQQQQQQPQQQPQQHQQQNEVVKQFAQMHIGHKNKISTHNHCKMGYYSHLPQPKIDAATSTATMQNSQLHNNCLEGKNSNSNSGGGGENGNGNIGAGADNGIGSGTPITVAKGMSTESTRL